MKRTEHLVIKDNNKTAMDYLIAQNTKVKLIYLDPPYGVGGQEYGYDNRSKKLSEEFDGVLYRSWALLAEEGSIWVSMNDDNLAGTITNLRQFFGKQNFIANVIWQSTPSGNSMSARFFRKCHEYILVYAKDKRKCMFNPSPKHPNWHKGVYRNTDKDPKGPYYRCSCKRTVLASSGTTRQYDVVDPQTGITYSSGPNHEWRFSKEKMDSYIKQGRISFPKNVKQTVRVKYYLTDDKPYTYLKTIWGCDEVGTAQLAGKEARLSNTEDPFLTPKPLSLMERIISTATDRDDIILDAYGGSGTTAVAGAKLGRKTITIEELDYAQTHICKRLENAGYPYTYYDRSTDRMWQDKDVDGSNEDSTSTDEEPSSTDVCQGGTLPDADSTQHDDGRS